MLCLRYFCCLVNAAIQRHGNSIACRDTVFCFYEEKNKATCIHNARRCEVDQNIFLLGDVAKLVGVKPYQITYQISIGALPDVVKLGARRVFRRHDVDFIVAFFKKRRGR